MGAADVIPGVSGGTIAFIAGIYEELLTSIQRINLRALKILKQKGIIAFWRYVNAPFLITLVAGIFISLLLLAGRVKWLLEHKPILLWSFFFGLIIASILFVAKAISRWSFKTLLMLFIGAVAAYYITQLPPSTDTDNLIFLFFAAALAICAMILPGISGAFILVILGAYKPLLNALHQLNFLLLGVAIMGALFGLFSFSRLLKWLLTHYKNSTLAILTGFIIGSLTKIWPWKRTLTWYLDSEGEKIPMLQKNISPFHYPGDSQFLYAILLALAGFLLVFFLEKIGRDKPSSLT